jgi:hypothetical protein
LNTAKWNNLTSGLAGAIIGAFAGFVGSVLQNWRTTRRTQRAAARAVLAEMFTNAERALIAESTFVLHEFLVGAISVRRRREKVCSWFLDVADEWVKAMRLLRPGNSSA